ncbi:guanine deaminase [soil metagenome]
MSETRHALRGHVIDAPDFGRLRAIPDAAVVIARGKVETVVSASDLAGADIEWINTGARCPVIVPGLIDIHAHLPQYPAVARTEDGLLPWLNRHIFPCERGFRNDRAVGLSEAFFRRLAANGTTTAMLYAAIWEESCESAFVAAEQSGIRAIIGKVMMDEGSYGDFAPEPTRALSVAQTDRLCARWHGAGGGLLEYAVSPRFAVTCSAGLMRDAAALAERHGAYIQTHLSENHLEISTVAERFPEARDYTDVYDAAGLLGERTVLGHCLHLSDREIGVLAERGSAVAHCPTSNFFLDSGLMPLDRLRAAGLRIGLGSDVAGGPELNLWQVMREAVNAQKARRFADPQVAALTPSGAFYLATQGGAEALGKGALIGTVQPGKEADLVVLDLEAVLPMEGRFAGDDPLAPEAVIDALVYRGGPGAVRRVLVKGRTVF